MKLNSSAIKNVKFVGSTGVDITFVSGKTYYYAATPSTLNAMALALDCPETSAGRLVNELLKTDKLIPRC